MKKVIWVVGEPGVGKTQLCGLFLGTIGPKTETWARPKWTVFGGRVAAAGHWGIGRFDGADTLPIGDLKPAVGAWADLLYGKVEMTIFDGDKLSADWAVERAGQLPDVQLYCFLLQAPEQAVLQRRIERATNQNAAWVRGRKTKAEKFAARFPGQVVKIQADRPTSSLLVEFVQALS